MIRDSDSVIFVDGDDRLHAAVDRAWKAIPADARAELKRGFRDGGALVHCPATSSPSPVDWAIEIPRELLDGTDEELTATVARLMASLLVRHREKSAAAWAFGKSEGEIAAGWGFPDEVERAVISEWDLIPSQ